MNSAESSGPVVVGVDGSDAAIGAAEWAAKEAVHQASRFVSFTSSRSLTGRRAPIVLMLLSISGRRELFACSSFGGGGVRPAGQDRHRRALRRRRLCTDRRVERRQASSAPDLWGSVGWPTWCSGRPRRFLPRKRTARSAIIRRDEKSPPLGAGLIAVVVDDRPGNRDVVRCAMEEARVRQAPVLALCVGRRAFFESSRDRFYRRLDGLLRRYPDVRD